MIIARRAQTCTVNPLHGYYIGASSSPTFVLVLGVDGDMVRYVNAHSLAEPRASVSIFGSLASSALATLAKDAARTAAAAEGADMTTAVGRLSRQVADMCAARVAAHGAPVVLSDYDKVELRVSAPGEIDVYGVAKMWGVVGDWNHEANAVSVECDREDIARLVAAGLTVESVSLVKACPR